MVIETYSTGPEAVNERFTTRGRMLPDGLEYIDSWIDSESRSRCYQLMRTDTPELFDEWIAKWTDLVDFEVRPVLTSAQMSASFENGNT